MYCKQCGNQIGDQEKFCTQCGAKLQFQENSMTDITINPTTSAISKPILKRREYFKTVSEKAVRIKAKILDILVGIMLITSVFSFIYKVWTTITIRNMLMSMNRPVNGKFEFPISFYLLCLATAVLCILGIRFKHYGLTVPLLFVGLEPSIMTSVAITSNHLIRVMIFLIMLCVLIAIVVLSILVTRSYNKYKKSSEQFCGTLKIK